MVSDDGHVILQYKDRRRIFEETGLKDVYNTRCTVNFGR